MSDEPKSDVDVLMDELKAIHPSHAQLIEKSLAGHYHNLHQSGRRLTALCLSGGGIRSATFSLGVLQGLARRGWLQEFDYLSTVSGGGYIGSWLTSWLGRAGFEDVVKALTRSTESGPSEPAPLKHLRRHSNYLSPLMGLTTDFLALVATLLRNLLLNWLVLVPLLLVVSLLPWFWLGVQASAASVGPGWVVVTAAMILLAAMVCAHIPPSEKWPASSRDRVTIGLILLAALVGSLLPYPRWSTDWRAIGTVPAILVGVWIGFSIYVVILRKTLSKTPGEYWTRIGGWLLMFAVAWLALHALVIWLVPYWLDVLHNVEVIRSQRLDSLETLQRLLTEQQRSSKPIDQEFLNSAYLASLKWDAAAKLAASSNSLIQSLASPTSMGVLGLVIGGAVSIVGYRSDNGPRPGSEQPPGMLSILAVQTLNIAALAFLVLVMFGSSWLATKGLIAIGFLPPSDQATSVAALAKSTPFVLAIMFGLLLWSGVAAWLIGVNEFSLYGFYRRRLRGAYIEASRDTSSEAAPEGPISAGERSQRPFHIVNAALNLTTPTKEYAHWQERKAASFTFSCLHAGSSESGYQDAATYADRLTLSQAIAISGAAAAPNMGYHTSTLVSFVMTFFNVRLGAWLPNPSVSRVNEGWRLEPRHPLRLLLQELFGNSTKSSPYVYLSDGGHFENLGLYEMVRRRCRGIVVVDAGCDPDYGFEDLENAVRKIRIDLGIRVEFPQGVPKPDSAPGSGRHFAIGAIRYSDQDPDGPDGTIIYVKPLLNGDEPFDVAGFAAEHSHEGDFFPHQPTSNQFFTESQFESYRMLGLHSVSKDFPEPGSWPVARDVSTQLPLPIARSEAGSATPSGSHQPSEASSRWFETAARMGAATWVPFVATAAAAGALTAITATIVITNIGGTIIETPPTDPPPQIDVSTPVIAIPTTVSGSGPVNRIMLPFFEEAEGCAATDRRDECVLLAFNFQSPNGLPSGEERLLKLSSVGITGDAQASILKRIREALDRCFSGGNRGALKAIEVRGFASSSEYKDVAGPASQSFNLALADARAESVGKALGDFGQVMRWTPGSGVKKTVSEAFEEMVEARVYRDRLGNGFDIKAANLTRRVDLFVDSSVLGDCSPDLLSAARGGTPQNSAAR